MIDKELISENIGKQNTGRAKFNDFITNMWYNEITLSEKGSIYYDYLKRVMGAEIGRASCRERV